ncbi:hypothetical protein [Leptospira vanthielii]|uniref:Uncharacterized protein n=1 Tax=Leptospira vanthielii serovar Holland str. Waz Holland = ATCC 700522 TaxID=1218591 RepID=N1WCK2_9LEPT|nr:hypothetical protein [Leptospira vanthielii]EMY70947.1 hypothetical protein LEP1GSC199_0205 [Leptospira vanthielii serovar Holland str. Waz Holland = ATCC 700522]
MKPIRLIFLLLFLFTCAHRKPDSLLWLFPLLGNGNGSTSQTIPEEPTNPAETLLPTFIQMTILKPESIETFCPLYGGLFIQYRQGEEKTCNPAEWDSSCVNIRIDENGTQVLLDPRSYAGVDLPTNLEVDSNLFPKDKKSNLFCFSRPIPIDTNHIEMYSFQNQSKDISINNCYTSMVESRCVDSITLLGSAEFIMPKEFPIVIADGNGHSGSHTLELNYVSEENLYTTCVYIGNEHKSLQGFTSNAYISGNPAAKDKNGYCIQCESNYCNSVDPNTGLAIVSVPVNRFAIPVGETITAKSEISLSVIKGQGPFKHTVRWTIEGFRQIVTFEEISILTANSIFLLWFLVPSLVMIFYFYHKKWKHWIRK